MPAKFELKKTRAGFVFHLKAPNGKVILASEPFPDKPTALTSIALIQKYSAIETCYTIQPTKQSGPRFVLSTLEGELLSSSEPYQGIKGCRNGIASTIRFAPTARIVDLNPE